MLTETAVRAAKATEKPVKLFDGGGLYLLVNPQGSRLWRLKYRVHGREKLLAIGAYPDVSLKRAREKRDEARRLLADGFDPSAQRKAEKLAHGETFEKIAAEWLDQQRKRFSQASIEKAEWMLNDLLNPFIGSKPITTITAPDILSVLRRTESRGRHETAHRLRQRIGQVFRYAVATGRADRDPTIELRGALAPVKSKSRAAITDPQKIGELLRAIDGYQGQPAVACALKLAPLLFVRPGELRSARWSEFSLDSKEPEWRIPGERMKMGELHIVPLSRQSVAVLRELEAHTSYSTYLFPSHFNATDQREHDQRRVTTTRLQQGRDVWTRLPCNGFDLLERTRLASRPHRAAASACRAQQGPSGIQPCGAIDRATQDDAGMGRLS